MNGFLKPVKNRVETDSACNGPIQIFFKLRKQNRFIIVVKGIDNLIGKTNKAINVINILANGSRQQFNGNGKRRTVLMGDDFAAAMGNLVENGFHQWCFSMSSATNFPEISAGGTPGPGTVNCPAKYIFFMVLLFNFGLKNAVCRKVLAKP